LPNRSKYIKDDSLPEVFHQKCLQRSGADTFKQSEVLWQIKTGCQVVFTEHSLYTVEKESCGREKLKEFSLDKREWGNRRML
jgi:hypothetical protein